ncbi:hypothetical protein [Flavihumibacter fluvii]|uniref:hypothetical protein n=1 Tax=Flavihumibacter fluvii TaxID=2838157 RepID=UPI001BDE1BE9|nr:hypothetical protein [Flavihumibacter fluvii]ULQ52971.1 hypothetical protein KJS93_01405 [Flavihumibacter fluvii]
MINLSSKDRITREELYELVWSEPIAVITRKNELSEYLIRKACKTMNIPTPKAGYWENVRLGKKINRCTLTNDPSAMPFVDLSSIKKIRTTAARTSVNKYNGLFSSAQNELDIRVSEAMMDRAIRWMNYFIETMKTRNHDIIHENGHTYVVMYGQPIKIYLRELTKSTGPRTKLINTPLVPTGLLAFKIDGFGGKEWCDGNATLEAQFIAIIEELENKAKAQNEKALGRETEKVTARKIEMNTRLKRSLAEKELEHFKQLLQLAERWQKAQTLKAYITHWKTQAMAIDEMTPEMVEKIEWAEEKADWYDPNVDGEDELFSGIDKNTLEFKSGEANFHIRYTAV